MVKKLSIMIKNFIEYLKGNKIRGTKYKTLNQSNDSNDLND
jgi:hypothetical protein